MIKPNVHAFFDPVTKTVTYIVYEAIGSSCAIIDSVLDYDAKSGKITTHSADQLIKFIKDYQLNVEWILETHAHADHLSAAAYLRRKLGGRVAIGEQITQVQATFKALFNFGDEFMADGSQFDHLFKEGELFKIGQLEAKIMHLSGHTPADTAYCIGDAIFVGDTLFMPDVGTARCDFPGGNASELYQSIQKLLSFPDDTRLFMCHDYPPSNRNIGWKSSVAEQRIHNIHVHEGISEAQFLELRHWRDAGLEMPALMLPAIQINIRGGEMPSTESNGIAYLKIPLITSYL